MTEIAVQQQVIWTELRDERGKLLARLERRQGLIEFRRNHATLVFRLDDLFDWHRTELVDIPTAVGE